MAPGSRATEGVCDDALGEALPRLCSWPANTTLLTCMAGFAARLGHGLQPAAAASSAVRRSEATAPAPAIFFETLAVLQD